MNVSISPEREEFIASALKDGRYASVAAVVEESLRLLEERERKLKDLRDTIDASLMEEGGYSTEEVLARIGATLEAHRSKKAAA